tara:strand:- start:34426 stop:35271 length:846 start_codon:yes stop_codon:yes gene_type:complete
MYTKTNKEIFRFKVFLDQDIEKEVDVEKEVEVEKDVEVQKTRKKDGKTEKYTVTEKQTVKEKQIVKEKRIEKETTNHEFVLSQPTRRQMEEADMEYSIEMSRCVKQGVLTKAMLLNKYSDSGGIMSEAEAKALADMYGRLSELQTEFTSWKISDKQKFSDKQKEVVDEMANLRRDIAKTETNFSALLNHTADNKAQAKVISWYLLFLTKLVNEKGDLEDYFRGETFDEKLESLYIMEESEDDLLALVYDKLTAFTSFWYFSVSATKEDFENLERDIEEGAL